MTDLLGNFWVVLGLKVIIVALVAPAIALGFIFAELKISAHMQSRIGPYFAGGRWGWAQPLADGVKFMQKEDLIPRDADRLVFKAAPAMMLMSSFAVLVIIPFGPRVIIRDLDVGIFYALAVSSFATIAVLMAGWSSANKYSLIGGMRAGAQLIAYELPLILAVVGVVIHAGTMSMGGIVAAQVDPVFHLGTVGIPLPFILQGHFVGFSIFMIASLAELNRTPFDLPIAEQELVMGYLTEYSGLRFTMFFLAEYVGMFSLSAIAATLFLGGYYLPGIPVGMLDYLGPLVVIGKASVLVFIMIWMRWTFPRLRQDQLQILAWKWLVPLALINILVIATLKVVF